MLGLGTSHSNVRFSYFQNICILIFLIMKRQRMSFFNFSQYHLLLTNKIINISKNQKIIPQLIKMYFVIQIFLFLFLLFVYFCVYIFKTMLYLNKFNLITVIIRYIDVFSIKFGCKIQIWVYFQTMFYCFPMLNNLIFSNFLKSYEQNFGFSLV